jgi:hypothetical protein
LPMCQPPVPALSISISVSRPSSSRRWAITPSAVGDRQMFPRHTNSKRTAGSLPDAGRG